MTQRHTTVLRRHFGFAIFLISLIILFAKPIANLINFSLTHDYASYIILVLPVSLVLIYLRQDRIFASAETSPVAGVLLFLIGIIFWWVAERKMPASLRDNELSLV